MSGNRTLSIIKPDAFHANNAGNILALLEKHGFTLIAARVMKLTNEQAGEFYAVLKARPFSGRLEPHPSGVDRASVHGGPAQAWHQR